MVGNAGKELVAKLATISVNGILMAAAKNWRIRFGLGAAEEGVCGSDIPRVIHGLFHGEVECDSIYVSDDNWGPLALTRDQVYTVISNDKDTSTPQGQKVITQTVKIKEFERNGPANADGVVRARLLGILTADPTIA